MESGVSRGGEDLAVLAAEAFFYGFPLVFDLQEVAGFEHGGIGDVPATPYNQFGHARALAGTETKFVSVNNDTVYSIANVDVSGGPVPLEVPDTHGRYYVLQFVDAWTNNFAYVGHRATGTEAGRSFSSGTRLGGRGRRVGSRVIRFPTSIATIVGRWAVDGESDMPNVAELQARLRLTPTAPGRRSARGGSFGARGSAVLRAAAGVDGGFPAVRSRPGLPAAVSSRSACSQRNLRTRTLTASSRRPARRRSRAPNRSME